MVIQVNRAVLSGTSIRISSVSVDLAHVLPPVDEMRRKDEPIEVDAMVAEQLRRLPTENGAGLQMRLTRFVVHGNSFIEILTESSELKAILIILGVVQHSVFRKTCTRHNHLPHPGVHRLSRAHAARISSLVR